MSAKTITVTPQTMLCELQEIKILREADFDIDQYSENSAKIAPHRVEKHESQLLEGVNLDESALNEEQKEEANKMFRKWNNIFSKGDLDIGHTRLVEHNIKLNNEEPFKDPHRRIPPGIITEVREHIQEILNAHQEQRESILLKCCDNAKEGRYHPLLCRLPKVKQSHYQGRVCHTPD